jgi:5-methylcytosine-specific restriction endonuclease McrA
MTPEQRLSRREVERKAGAKRRGASTCEHPACLTSGADLLAWQSNPHVCYLCGIPVASMAWMDHVVPIARGGIHCAENLRPACESCNRRKHDKLLAAEHLLGKLRGAK